MIYASVSIKEVMARVIRMTRVKDTSYIADMDEWIFQAMELMRTKMVLGLRYADVVIDFHKGALPKGTRSIAAVEWNGHRIPQGNSVRTPTAPEPDHRFGSQFKGTTNGFEFVPQYYYPQNDAENHGRIETLDLKSVTTQECMSYPCMEGTWYQTEMGIITLNIPHAKVRVHYRCVPCDKDGLPLIPDNGDYKEACYLYCRAAMIGAGWEDKIMNYQMIMDHDRGLFWRHAAKAMGSIKYPSVDSMEFKVNEFQRLIKDNFYFDNFFSSPHQEPIYGYDEYLANLNPGTPRTYLNPGDPNNKDKDSIGW